MRCHRRHRSLLSLVAAACLSVVVSLLPSLALASPVARSLLRQSAVDTGSGSGSGMLVAAEYFGAADPFNFWSSDLSGAPSAFRQMKQDGFNTVGLVVPWGEFQPGLNPPRYDNQMFSRLDTMISYAAHQGLGVILRLSYDWDVDPADQMPWNQRFDAVFSNPRVYNAWLDYIAAIHKSVARFSNVRLGYISWEDFWFPVSEAQSATSSAQALNLASSTGYRAWLRQHNSLAQVSTTYGTHFTSWGEVPTPPPDQPSFRLMYEYEDWALVHRFFIPASKRFPGLSMETRVDVDPIYNGQQVVGSFSHSDLYRLPGAPVTGMYFSPYMNDPSTSLDENASQGLSALRTTLQNMSTESGNRRLFIFEFEIVSNAPPVAGDPNLTPAEVPAFLEQSAPLLRQYTKGYALWTYRDFNLSGLFNPSFSLGTTGWQVHGSAHARTGGSPSLIQLSPNSSVSQSIPSSEGPGQGQPTITFEATTPRPATVTVQWGTGAPQTVDLSAGTQTYTLTAPGSSNSRIALGAGKSTISLTDVQVFWFTQVGDVYNAVGAPEVGVAPLQQLNHALTSTGSQ
jgi:hypothetical protein